MPNVSADSSVFKSFGFDQIREKQIEAARAKLEKAQKPAQEMHDKINALGELQYHTKNLMQPLVKLAFGDVAQQQNNVFAARGVDVSTSDIGDYKQYLNAFASSKAAKGTHTVSVNQIATSAIFKSKPFASTYVALGDADVAVRITKPDGTNDNVAITLTAGSTLTNILTTLNNDLANFNVSVSLMQTMPDNPANANNQCYFVFTDMQTGNYAINVDQANIAGGTFFGDVNAQQNTPIYANSTTGTNALVTFDGIQVTSISNQIKDIIPGISLNLSKANTLGASQTLQVDHDASVVDNGISNFIKEVNQYLLFIAKQKQRDTDLEQQEIDDMMRDGRNSQNEKRTYFKDTPLRDSAALNFIKTNLLNAFRTTINISPTESISLDDLGMQLVELQAEGTGDSALPARSQLMITDATKYKNALSTRFDAVEKLFTTKLEVAQNANHATISLMTQTSILPPRIAQGLTQPQLRINVLNGNINTAQFSLDNGTSWVDAQYQNNVITFTNTDLNGLSLGIALNGSP